ncbi:MAG TPA: SDR family oxidoreductase [Cyclobacteriaceae bacterium]|nr:SDR family oxidoreductase [Cyclobacteriaceae bacterium]
MKKFEGKTVFITGGLSGIGKACAVAAAKEGANVAIVDIKSVNYDSAMLEVKAENESAVFIECDVTKMDQVKRAVDQAAATFGSIDIALNNAGIPAEQSRIAEMTEGDWSSVLNVNLTSVFNCMKHELTQMSIQKKGVVINMSSVLGKVGFAGWAGFVAAEHGILGLTKSAALEYAHEGIRVNAIAPGFIDTPLLTKGGLNDNEKIKQQILGLHPLKRLGKAEEVACAFLFLASPESSFITGMTLEIDGGYLAQ